MGCEAIVSRSFVQVARMCAFLVLYAREHAHASAVG